MRFILHFSLFCFMTIFLTSCNFGNDIAVVDIQKVLNESRNGRKAKEHFIAIQNVFQQNINVIQAKLEAYPNKEQVEFLLSTTLGAFQKELDQINQQLNINTINSVYQIIKIYQEEKQFDIIMLNTQVIVHANKIDITNDIIKAFDKETLVFDDLPKMTVDPILPKPLPMEEEDKEVNEKANEETNEKDNE